METFVWLRVPGDVVFAAGTLYLAWFAIGLLGLRPGSPARAAVPAAQQAKA
jgi:nitric oxide reductase subunit B